MTACLLGYYTSATIQTGNVGKTVTSVSEIVTEIGERFGRFS